MSIVKKYLLILSISFLNLQFVSALPITQEEKVHVIYKIYSIMHKDLMVLNNKIAFHDITQIAEAWWEIWTEKQKSKDTLRKYFHTGMMYGQIIVQDIMELSSKAKQTDSREEFARYINRILKRFFSHCTIVPFDQELVNCWLKVINQSLPIGVSFKMEEFPKDDYPKILIKSEKDSGIFKNNTHFYFNKPHFFSQYFDKEIPFELCEITEIDRNKKQIKWRFSLTEEDKPIIYWFTDNTTFSKVMHKKAELTDATQTRIDKALSVARGVSKLKINTFSWDSYHELFLKLY